MGRTVCLNVNVLLRTFIKTMGMISLMLSLSWKLTFLVLMETPITGLIQNIYDTHYQVKAGWQKTMNYNLICRTSSNIVNILSWINIIPQRLIWFHTSQFELWCLLWSGVLESFLKSKTTTLVFDKNFHTTWQRADRSKAGLHKEARKILKHWFRWKHVYVLQTKTKKISPMCNIKL